MLELKKIFHEQYFRPLVEDWRLREGPHLAAGMLRLEDVVSRAEPLSPASAPDSRQETVSVRVIGGMTHCISVLCENKNGLAMMKSSQSGM